MTVLSSQKTSLLVPYQLPAFISEDPNYANFILFLQAYYEWMEQEGNVLDFSKNMLNYIDVDNTTEEFLKYYVNDFMSYFPQDILADQTKVLKVAKQLYQTKGTPVSYQFLFRILYNTDVDFFYTKDVVLKASAGQWYVPRSLKLDTSDPNFLQISSLRLFGKSSKSIATVENAVYDGLKTEVFISNIERLFQSGEEVLVVDANNQAVYFLGGNAVPSNTIGAETLTATIVGQISQLTINPGYRGSLYDVGDPVVFHGGLNPNTPNPIGASATIGSVTSGGIQRISVSTEGYGYTPSLYSGVVGAGNTQITFSNIPSNSGVMASVGALDQNGAASIFNIPVDSIFKKIHIPLSNSNYYFANATSANANTTLVKALTFTSLMTNPIESVIVTNQGGGITTLPTISATSLYNSDNPIGEVQGIEQFSQGNLANLGILAPIQIINGGVGYTVGQRINLVGGTGRGAYANVTSVNTTGSIISAGYTNAPSGNVQYPTGGMNYTGGLPTVIVVANTTGTLTTSNSSNVVSGAGTSFTTQLSVGSTLYSNTNLSIGVVKSIANNNVAYLVANSNYTLNSNSFYNSTSDLIVPGIMGMGASFTSVANRIGSIINFNISNNGDDYISNPIVSLAVQDMLVSGITTSTIPNQGDKIYQGANSNSAIYSATVDSITELQRNDNPANSVYQLRVFDYNSKPVNNPIYPLKIDSNSARITLVPNYSESMPLPSFSLTDSRFDSANGVIQYGDGTAKANTTFLNGLVIGNGQYIGTSGQPSSYDVIQSTDYNNYTYEITLEKEIAKYRDVLLNLLHPTGMRVIGRFKMESNNAYNYSSVDELYRGHDLSYYTGSNASNTTMVGSFSNPSNNVITINNLPNGFNIANIFIANTSTIRFQTSNNIVFESMVTGVNYIANTITTKESAWLAIANVAYGVSNTGINSIINIEYLTNSFNLVNGGVYSNTQYPLMDIIHAGDTVMINTSTQVVSSINYANNTIYLKGPLANGANGLVSVNRILNSTNVQIFGPFSAQGFVIIDTEAGQDIITEDGNSIILG